MEFKTRIISVDFLLAAMLLFIIAAKNNENINILEYMKNGMENPAVVDYYQEGINDVMTITYSKRITIWYYETDLNDDGMDDLIAIVGSPLHSGAHGDSFDILFNNGDYYSEGKMGYTFRLIDDLKDDYVAYGKVYILQSKTNGYHDLEVFTDENHFFMKYENGSYQYVPIDIL